MKPHGDRLAQCSNCRRYGWHSNERPEISAFDSALLLDSAVNLIDLARSDGNKVLRALPRDTGLFQVVDLVAALGHLRQAAVLIDRCADALEAEEVRR